MKSSTGLGMLYNLDFGTLGPRTIFSRPPFRQETIRDFWVRKWVLLRDPVYHEQRGPNSPSSYCTLQIYILSEEMIIGVLPNIYITMQNRLTSLSIESLNSTFSESL